MPTLNASQVEQIDDVPCRSEWNGSNAMNGSNAINGSKDRSPARTGLSLSLYYSLPVQINSPTLTNLSQHSTHLR